MIDASHPLLLGSGSPRRREILTTLGIPIRVLTASVDESVNEGEGPMEYLARIAEMKLAAIVRMVEGRKHGIGSEEIGGILVADTTVIVGGRILGKPADEAEARAMLRDLSGRAHEVATRFAIAGPGDAARTLHAETVTSTVVFRALDEAEIEGYAATGEGLDKAGAYAVQGIGAFAVSRIEGSYANVVGLPACEVVAALKASGLVAAFPLPRAVTA